MTYYESNLPHWLPERAEPFLTWRLYGSLPAKVVARLKIDADRPGRQFARAERLLEKNPKGPLWLLDQRIAESIEAAILRGQNKLGQYNVLAYVVMPNHVHLLIAPNANLGRITNGLKGVTARDANRILKRTGNPFWQGESFDHWVRDAAESQQIIEYIENNPVKANLAKRAEDWLWSSARRAKRDCPRDFRLTEGAQLDC
jgi:putative transposase